ncbi:MAG: hypothetical protein CO150_02340 [Nitrospirae bacterium CG_4_9_14_3_um_filter_53_35]|nr:MAG: hypothetical protein AUK29_02090 [Nitrospirae bacterium CG2_30_53_67]PIS38190.1 MAG: hypothetical protein COT35_02120 [Nitrospirae bacterium CG08_land_8_20_14_0_20_52_24]PIW85301.1 MAG: hypothetical protein COZ95_05210 [Nitrospirae bacterium CG_4_8_14_3_um_filter_50_41]PIX85266.1 MAG: hypothetical protein COZ32_09390 [Nitrospirae bacterium CG_4_10_14_3_um_filter_53_41]PJA76916.1 MAG: hypothetical protein CO150_02340 [Nitrospirae bacterium CG_4_9_14_3_um_filter_53_35]
MKDLEACNYYELLEITEETPKNIIQEAYQSYCTLFDKDSIVSYNFISPHEREEMLNRIRKAYEILMDDQKRIQYDKKIFNRIGRWHHAAAEGSVPGGQGSTETPGKRIEQIRMEDFIEETGQVSLRRLRESIGITIEKVSMITKIRIPILHALENRDFSRLPSPIYVKGYLKSYARVAGIEPEKLIQAYGPLSAPIRR